MASITSQGIEIPSVNAINYIFGQSIAHHPEFHARTKHIDIAFHFLCDHVQKGAIDLSYINTDYNIADIFTKPLRKPIHETFTYKLGVISDQGGVLR